MIIARGPGGQSLSDRDEGGGYPELRVSALLRDMSLSDGVLVKNLNFEDRFPEKPRKFSPR